MANEIYIADKVTLDLIKTQTDAIKEQTVVINADTDDIQTKVIAIKADTTTLKTDVALIKTSTGAGATYGDTFSEITNDQMYPVVSLTGKYELLYVQNTLTSSGSISIRIDGATNRKLVILPANTTINLSNLGIKCATSMTVYSFANTSVVARYRMLP